MLKMILSLLTLYIIVMTVVTFIVCAVDKFSAKKQLRRVPEKTLFLLSALGGSVGMYAGMLTFRHKTQHWYFKYGIPAIIIVQVAVMFFIYRLFWIV